MIQRFMDEFSKWWPWTPTGRAVLLGIEFETSDQSQRENFYEDFRSRIQMTYRSGFSPPMKLVSGSEIYSDTGWGCMLRVMQMMLAQCFANIALGRDWRFDKTRDLREASPYLEIVSCFLDIPEAPFSLHNFVATGQRVLLKEPSAWFGPTSAAQVANRLLEACMEPNADTRFVPAFLRQLRCVVFEDGAIFKASVLEHFEGPTSAEAVIIFVCQRLGLEDFKADLYRPGVESCFSLSEFQGLASGNSTNSAHFFVATHGDSLTS